MSAPGQTIGVSVFTDPLIQSFNISRVNLSLAYLLGTITSALILTHAGRLYDKYGARLIATLAAFFLGTVLVYMTQLDKVVGHITFILPSIDRQLLTFVFAAFGFLGIRFFGQGVLTMVSKNMVMKWFNKKRGLASAIMGVFIAFGFSAAPRLFKSLIDTFGWRGAWLIIAGIVGIGFVIFAILVFRDNPHDYGLIPDGKVYQLKSSKAPVYQSRRNYTLSEARRTFSFWIFNLALALYALFFTAMTFQVVSIFENAGMDETRAISIFIPSAMIAVAVNILVGWISDYIRLKYILFIQLFGLVLSSLGIMILKDGYPVWLIIIGNGMAQGVFGIISSVTWPRFFGIAHLGAISGFNLSWTVAGSAVGPYFFSLMLNWTGAYRFGALACMLAAAVLFILAFKADNVNEVKSHERSG